MLKVKAVFQKNEFLQFLYYARGSLYETITIIIIFYRKEWINQDEHASFRVMSNELSIKLNALINSIKRGMK
ncbi:MAG: four helix bundle protein [Bacteroidales bacterium]|nr:four helix bundle protein [Bacteroidales bacterium]MCF8345550.1 four helix bundle protein [Bacteroidales bacterium]MCF8351047.1 four helix bundle protein [Bacteroidales bacterium]MCF8375887.1 four helix bundle protein [Bacteroidales bacterium]MCF8402011.1 four helix bundle protein [Bacteroidales bacterium]